MVLDPVVGFLQVPQESGPRSKSAAMTELAGRGRSRLMLVIEGILPFYRAALWRETFAAIGELTDGQLRFAGLASMWPGLA
jgi:uncharacterized protein YjeT (DUF2065 family)